MEDKFSTSTLYMQETMSFWVLSSRLDVRIMC